MNKAHYKSLVAAAIFTGLAQQTASATALEKIYSSQDTWVNINHGGKETNMRGDKADMKIDDNFTAFVQFVIPPLPTGEVIDKVMLEMKVTGLNPIPDAYISELTDPAVIWDETAVTEPSWPFEIGEKIPGASIVSDPNSDPSTWILQKGEKYQFDITSAVTGAGTYTFNVDSEFSTKAAGILDRKFGAGIYSNDLATQLGRPALIITTKPTPDITAPVISIPADIIIAATDDKGTADTAAELANFLTAATANDAVDGIIVVSHDAPAVFPLGETTVTFEASDTSANTETMAAKVTITDQTAPIIALVGDNAPTLGTGNIYSEQGATAQDNVEGDISVDVIIGGDIVNTTTPGTYKVTYNLTDLAGNVANEITRQVTVQDASAPVINVPDNISVAATDQNGTNNLDSSISTFLTTATANDDVDGSVTVTHNAPNPFPIGETVVTFSAKDSSDNIGTSQAKVTISDQTSPVIMLVGDSAITVNLGDSYVEPGFSALDNVDNDISSKVAIAGDTIDTNAEGIYTITYNTSDTAGNAALEKTRTITIQDIASPTVSAPENITVAATDHLGTDDSDASISAFLAAATASDIIDGTISVTHNAPTLFPIGITTVSFSAVDSDNKTGIAQATVTIIDQTAPVITLAGEDSITLYLNQAYNEAGYSAQDNVDGDISANVVVDGDIVNTTTTGTYTVTYNLADLAGNNAVQLTRQINVIIEPNNDDTEIDDNTDSVVDSDYDGVPDSEDAFPEDANETVDTDGDKIGNNTDIDDDNDGIIDADDSASLDPAIGDSQAPTIADTEALTIEATGEFTELSLTAPQVTDNNLNAPSIVPDLTAPLPIGEHKITWTATDFAGNTATTQQLITIVDTTAPKFDELTTKTINARGLLTDISADINTMASDLVDGELSATLIGEVKYRAGNHTVKLMVTDSSGNTSSTEQVIHINPLVEMARGVNLAPGSRYVLPITLSGQAAVYPVTISYALSGVITGGNITETITETNGEIVIDSGLVGEVEFKISEQAIENDLVTVTLLSANNAVIADESSLFTVIETNIAPTVTLSVEQNGQSVSTIDATAGVVTVTATVSDTNYLDKHNVSWSVADSAIMDLSADNSDLTFEFSPEQLNSGTYGLSLSVAENNTDELFVINIDSSLFVATALVVLSNESDSDNDGIADSDEGYSDSDGDGIADYLDNDNNVSRLPSSDGAEPMQTVKGLVLSLGDIVRQAGNASAGDASINLDELAANGGENGESADNATNTSFTPVSNILNFNVSGLSYTGESVPVIIPLADNQFIPQDAVYKKYSLAKGWFDFVVDENNTISSAMINSDGNCPAPLSDVYLIGLQAGDNCIQLLIEDGGENDADKQANGVIKDPGVLAVNGPNAAPVLNMISPLNVDENTLVTLDASSSTDADNNVLSYRWAQTSGVDVDLTGQDGAVLSFTAPSVTSEESLSFSLTVNDDAVAVTEEYTITVSNIVELVAQINAHEAQTRESTIIELEADDNINYDGNPSYYWQQISGPEVSLSESEATDSSIKFFAPEVSSDQMIEFKLTVIHGDMQISKTTSLTVTNVEEKQTGGSMAWLLAFGALLLRRKDIKFYKNS